jgi:hypothetical protein
MLLRRVNCWLDKRHILVVRKYINVFPPQKLITLQDVQYPRKWLTSQAVEMVLETEDGGLGRLVFEEWNDILRHTRPMWSSLNLRNVPFQESSKWEELYAYKLHVEETDAATISFVSEPTTV